MYVDPPPQIEQIELQPVFTKGDLLDDEWWTSPAPKPARTWRRHILFGATFIAPVVLATIYLTLIASDEFVSETRYMVRGPLASSSLNFASLMNDQKVTRASDETYAVSEYLTSRDALRVLDNDEQLAQLFASSKADIFNRFPNFLSRATREARYQHFRRFVDVDLDYESGIATLRTRAFTPQDALSLNRALLADAQSFVNKLNDGVFTDTLKLASRHVDEARAQFADVEERLTDYRNRESVVDPIKESADQLARIGDLMSRLSEAETELARQTLLAPRSPQVTELSSDIEALRAQFDKQRTALSGLRGSTAAKFAEFDRLMLERLLASKSLEQALDQLSRARHDLEEQKYYLQTIVQPNLPDQPSYPRRLLSLIVVSGICGCIYLILSSLLTNVREHQA